jgi:hypothetical protein
MGGPRTVSPLQFDNNMQAFLTLSLFDIAAPLIALRS